MSDIRPALAAFAWLISVLLYLRYVLATRGALTSDLHDKTIGPFASLALITPILLATDGIAPYWRPAAAVVVDVLIVGVVLLGAWLTGTWMRGGTDLDRLHPGDSRPTVAGGLVASAGAAEVGQQRLAQLMFGLGIVCWFIVGSMVFGRLIFLLPLPEKAPVPTMAIEVAPAAVASLAYFSTYGARITPFAAALAGYGLLMVLAQIPLLGRYLRLLEVLHGHLGLHLLVGCRGLDFAVLDQCRTRGWGTRPSVIWYWRPSASWSPPSLRAPLWPSLGAVSFPTHPPRPCRRQRRPDLGVPKPVCQDFDSSLRHSR